MNEEINGFSEPGKKLKGKEFQKLFEPSKGPTLSVNEIQRVLELIDKGLDTIYLCYHGSGRSPEFALDNIAFYDLPTISLYGGCEQLQRQKQANPVKFETAIEMIAKIPNVVVLLDDGDVGYYPEMTPLIEEVRTRTESKGNYFYSETYQQNGKTHRDYQTELIKRTKS